MSRQIDPRIIRAFAAMKNLGVAAETVKPVLKRLLKLYDKNWSLIEEDNYRTLADAIFEAMEEKDKAEYQGATVHDGPEPPSKKHHLLEDEDQASSTIYNGNMPAVAEAEIPQNLPRPALRALESEPSCHVSAGVPPSEIGEDPILLSLSPMQEFAAGGTSNAQEADEVYNVQVNNAVNATDGAEYIVGLEREQPLNHMKNYSIPESGKRISNAASHHHSVDIASSSCGQVAIALRSNHGLGQHSFQDPSLDLVLKLAESRYLHTNNVVLPQFSLINCLKELCESYLELSSDPAKSCLSKKNHDELLDSIMEHYIESPRSRFREQGLKRKVSGASGSSNPLFVGQQQSASHDSRRPSYKLPDISNRTEKVRISLVDEITEAKEKLPKFVYIPTNIVYENAYVNVSLARIADGDCCPGCRGDCLSAAVPCACARDTGGEFAYTTEGLVKEGFLTSCISMIEEPQKHYHYYCKDCPLERAKNGDRPEKCKGHLIRKFIKECWRKCGCSMQCGNRVVQRGISRKLQVFLTCEGKGWGLRTLEEMPKGAFVCEYVGEILTNMELYKRNKQNIKDRHTYPVLLDADWGSEGVLKDEEALCLDATHYGNVGRFINHRCYDANLLEIPVEVESPDHHYYHLAFFTKRKVNALEELTWDYGIDFEDQSHPIKAFQCCCGSANCRDKKGVEATTSHSRPPSKGKTVKAFPG